MEPEQSKAALEALREAIISLAILSRHECQPQKAGIAVQIEAREALDRIMGILKDAGIEAFANGLSER